MSTPYGNVMINGQVSVNLVAPELPKGLFFRVDRVKDDYYSTNRVRVTIREKGRYFGSKLVVHATVKDYNVTPERIHETMRNLILALEHNRTTEEREYQEEQRINKLLGDFPPRTSIRS
jgi:hypothetical protein